MPDNSPRLGLPYLIAAQAQKEVAHNEALQRLDLCVHPVAESVLSTPPAAPLTGACWLIGPNPTGGWTGKADAIAQWTDGGWRFFEPFEGLQLWMKATATGWIFTTGVWQNILPAASIRIGGVQVLGARQNAISGPTGGGTVDAEARAAITEIIAAIQAHGLIAN